MHDAESSKTLLLYSVPHPLDQLLGISGPCVLPCCRPRDAPCHIAFISWAHLCLHLEEATQSMVTLPHDHPLHSKSPPTYMFAAQSSPAAMAEMPDRVPAGGGGGVRV